MNPEIALRQEVERAAETYSHANKDTGIWLLVEKNGKQYKAAAGLADREKKIPVAVDQLFEIGSASKVFTGVAIFQLIEQGKLSLDTKLNTFYTKGEITKLAQYKGKNYWNEVTVGMLLRHRSGFVDYLNVYGGDEKAINIFSGKGRHYTFADIIHLSADFGDANFKPGEKFQYCNTGYVILGDIISRVSGINWHDYIRQHIMEKAGMVHTYFGTRIPQKERDKMPMGYVTMKPTAMPPSLADSAGEIISNLEDLARFIKAWGRGELYQKPKTLKIQLNEGFQQQYPTVANLYYGYGLVKIEGFYGHGGQTFGFESYMTINPQSGDVYIVGTNDAMVRSMDLFTALADIRLKDDMALQHTANCLKLTKNMALMTRGTESNRKKIMELRKVIQTATDIKAKTKATKELQAINQQTKTRMSNTQYPSMYDALKKSYEASCGTFSQESNATVTHAIENSILFNNIMAEVLGDALSLSKVKKP